MGPGVRRDDLGGRDLRGNLNPRQYLSNGLISCSKTNNNRERSVAEAKGQSGVSKALNAAWVRPFPVPDFYRCGLGSDHPLVPDSGLPNPRAWRCRRGALHRLAGTAAPVMADDLCDDLRLSLVGCVRHSRGDADRGLEGRWRATSIRLLVFSQSVPKIAIAPLFVVWFGFGLIPKVISAFLLGFLSGGGLRRAGF